MTKWQIKFFHETDDATPVRTMKVEAGTIEEVLEKITAQMHSSEKRADGDPQ